MGKRKQHKDDSVHPHSSVSQKFSEEHNVDEGNDTVSSLPENVLLRILSFLSTKDAIGTSILSRKWEYLWTSISIIKLDEFCGHHSIGVLMDLLEKSPKLEFLNFDQGFNPFYEDDWMFGRVTSCFTSSLKTVRIADFDEKLVEMQFIRFLLKKAAVLESSMLCNYSEDVEKQQRKVRLNNLPRGSKSCVIKLI